MFIYFLRVALLLIPTLQRHENCLYIYPRIANTIKTNLISSLPSSSSCVSTYGGLQINRSTNPVNRSVKPVKQSLRRMSNWVKLFSCMVDDAELQAWKQNWINKKRQVKTGFKISVATLRGVLTSDPKVWLTFGSLLWSSGYFPSNIAIQPTPNLVVVVMVHSNSTLRFVVKNRLSPNIVNHP